MMPYVRAVTTALRGCFIALVAAVTVLAVTPAAHAQSCSSNPICVENQQTGTPQDDWDTKDADESSSEKTQGFASEMGVNRGSTVSFKVKNTATSYKIDIYRIGYYGGDGARLIQGNLTKSAAQDQVSRTQPNCMTYPTAKTGLYDCGNWGVSATWTVPSTAVSGVYMAPAREQRGRRDRHLVRRPQRREHLSDLLPDERPDLAGVQRLRRQQPLRLQRQLPADDPKHSYMAASKVSYNRPLVTSGEQRPNTFMYDEYPMVRFLERNGYDVSYITGVDTDNATRGALIKNHKLFISSGHDEYWSGPQRANIEAARNAASRSTWRSSAATSCTGARASRTARSRARRPRPTAR